MRSGPSTTMTTTAISTSKRQSASFRTPWLIWQMAPDSTMMTLISASASSTKMAQARLSAVRWSSSLSKWRACERTDEGWYSVVYVPPWSSIESLKMSTTRSRSEALRSKVRQRSANSPTTPTSGRAADVAPLLLLLIIIFPDFEKCYLFTLITTPISTTKSI